MDTKKVNQALKKVRGLFLVMALVLVTSIAVSFYAGYAAVRAAERLRRHDEIIEHLQELRSTLLDAETGQRGYLLTRDEEFAEPYDAAMQDIRKRLDRLHAFVASQELAPERLASLEALVAEKLEELRNTIELVRSGRSSEAVKIVRRGGGRRLMDAIRAEISTALSGERRLRSAAEAVAARAMQYRTTTFLVAVFVNLAFLGWIYRRIRREILQQHVAALETQRQKEVLSVTLASIGDAVIITDTTAHITYLNHVAEKLTGWPAHEAYKQPCEKVFHIINEHTRARVESPVDHVLKHGTIAGLANHTLLIRKDGDEVPIDDSGAPIREEDGTVRGVVLVFRDFTAHKKAERMLIQGKEEIELASKAKDKFLATLSHELRMPLAPILTTLSSWEVNQDLPPALAPDLQLLRRNVEIEARLIDDLLDLTRIENGKMSLQKSTIDVHSVIDMVAALYRDDCLAKNIRLSLPLDAEFPFVEADPARLQQVFWNIAGNALKFSPDGGRLDIATRNPDPKILEINFTDSGIGMSQETLTHVFQPFAQADAAPGARSQGLGLGLSIARALVEAHGGTLTASSQGANRGSAFTIRLTTAAAAPSPSQPETETAELNRNPLRILLVEDHEDTAAVMKSVLSGVGHAVQLCSSVATAREKILGAEFDVILSDIGLPDGTGVDFIMAARQVCTTPAVALTGYGMAEDIEKCLRAGFDEHLTKPIDFERLQKTLARIAHKGVRNMPKPGP